MNNEIIGDRCRLVLLPLLSRARLLAGTAPLGRVATAAGVSRDRLWKLSRHLVLTTEEEAERVVRAAGPELGQGSERLAAFLHQDDDDLVVWLRERAPLPRQCVQCGSLGGRKSPLSPGYAVHEGCVGALHDVAQARWVAEVDERMELMGAAVMSAAGGSALFLRAWRAERSVDERPVNLFSLSTRAGMEFRTFRRAWILAGLPRRPLSRERPEPLSRRVRLAWTVQVEQRLAAAPEELQELQELWRRARAQGVRLNLEQLAEFARIPHWQFRKSWLAAGLPTPRKVLQALASQ